jgi:hypothetical protein
LFGIVVAQRGSHSGSHVVKIESRLRLSAAATGDDGIHFDYRADCRDSVHHCTCDGHWRGVVSLGFSADGKRVRKKVSGKTKTEVKDRLKELHSELDAGVRTVHGHTVEKAWLTCRPRGFLDAPPRRLRSTGTRSSH